jgi:hypothetical protein
MTRSKIAVLLLTVLLCGCAQQRMNSQAEVFLQGLHSDKAASPELAQLQQLRQQAHAQQSAGQATAAAPAARSETLLWQFSAAQLQPNEQQLKSFKLWYRQHPGSLYLAIGPAAAQADFNAAQSALARAQTLQKWLQQQGLHAELSYRPQLAPHQVQWLSSGGGGA